MIFTNIYSVLSIDLGEFLATRGQNKLSQECKSSLLLHKEGKINEILNLSNLK